MCTMSIGCGIAIAGVWIYAGMYSAMAGKTDHGLGFVRWVSFLMTVCLVCVEVILRTVVDHLFK